MPSRVAITGFLLLLLLPAAYAQKAIDKSIENYYKDNYDRSQCVRFYPDTFKNYQLRQIILVRHGQPMISRKGWRNRREAIEYMHGYDSVPVYPFEQSPVCTDSGILNLVYSSVLPRSISTAYQMFGDQVPVEHLKRFNEFQLKAICFPNIKLPVRFWTVTSRICWILGFNDKGIESFWEAKVRARGDAYFLEFKAEQGNNVVLVAHSFLNRYIKKYLKHQGWNALNLNAMHYLGVYVMYKVDKTDKIDIDE